MWRAIRLGLILAVLLSATAEAQTTVLDYGNLPLPATGQEWVGVELPDGTAMNKIPSGKIGQPYQGPVAPTGSACAANGCTFPFAYELWWNTINANLPALAIYDGAAWIPFETLNLSAHTLSLSVYQLTSATTIFAPGIQSQTGPLIMSVLSGPTLTLSTTSPQGAFAFSVPGGQTLFDFSNPNTGGGSSSAIEVATGSPNAFVELLQADGAPAGQIFSGTGDTGGLRLYTTTGPLTLSQGGTAATNPQLLLQSTLPQFLNQEQNAGGSVQVEVSNPLSNTGTIASFVAATGSNAAAVKLTQTDGGSPSAMLQSQSGDTGGLTVQAAAGNLVMNLAGTGNSALTMVAQGTAPQFTAAATNAGATTDFEVDNPSNIVSSAAEFVAVAGTGVGTYLQMFQSIGASPSAQINTGSGDTGGLSINAGAGSMLLTVASGPSFALQTPVPQAQLSYTNSAGATEFDVNNPAIAGGSTAVLAAGTSSTSVSLTQTANVNPSASLASGVGDTGGMSISTGAGALSLTAATALNLTAAAASAITQTIASGPTATLQAALPQFLVSAANNGATTEIELLNNTNGVGSKATLAVVTGTANANAAFIQIDGASPSALLQSGTGDLGGMTVATLAGNLTLSAATGPTLTLASAVPELNLADTISGGTNEFQIINNQTAANTTSEIALVTGSVNGYLQLLQQDGLTPTATILSGAGNSGGFNITAGVAPLTMTGGAVAGSPNIQIAGTSNPQFVFAYTKQNITTAIDVQNIDTHASTHAQFNAVTGTANAYVQIDQKDGGTPIGTISSGPGDTGGLALTTGAGPLALYGISVVNLGTPTSLQVGNLANAVDYLQIFGSVTANPALLDFQAAGTDNNIGFLFAGKGNAPFVFQTGASSNLIQAEILHTGSAVDYITLTGSATGAPGQVKIGANGSDGNISIALVPVGSGIVQATGTFNATVGYQANGTAGVTCPTGSPSASFATVGGIVTHC